MSKYVRNDISIIDEKNIRDDEWIDAWNTDEYSEYYKCEMLNHGWCYKYYKPSVAVLMLKRGKYLQMFRVS